jgi:hypothetical protein
MVLPGFLPEGFFDFFWRGIPPDAQHIIIIAFCHKTISL